VRHEALLSLERRKGVRAARDYAFAIACIGRSTMSLFSQSLPIPCRNALVMVDLGPGDRMESALLLPATAQTASVTDGTSNTIMFGIYAGRPVAKSAMASLWSRPDLLKSGFGLLLPLEEGAALRPGLLLPGLHVLPCIEPTALAGTAVASARAFKISGSVASNGGVLDTVGVWLTPLSIIAILIAL
jgi:hypothetical protein